MGIAERYIEVRKEVDAVCREFGRDPKEVTLLAVSKTTDAAGVGQAASVGAFEFGENRPDEILAKHSAFPQLSWNFIGNIQSRRIHEIVSVSSLIHSLCKESHAIKINEEAQRLGKVQRVLLEVNVSGEESKSGIPAYEIPDLLSTCAHLPNLEVCGLMTMAPQGDLRAAKDCFSGLRNQFRDVRSVMSPENSEKFTQLSMGMSEDWRCAIECGSTIVRIGRAIFSDEFEA